MSGQERKRRPYVFVHERLRGALETLLTGNLFPKRYLERRVVFEDELIEEAAGQARRILETTFRVSEGSRCGICGKIVPDRPAGAMHVHIRAHDFLGDLKDFEKSKGGAGSAEVAP